MDQPRSRFTMSWDAEPGLAPHGGGVSVTSQAHEVGSAAPAGGRAVTVPTCAGLHWEASEHQLADAVSRTEGTTASFAKELLRRTALLSLEQEPTRARPAVTGPALAAALAELLDSRNQMTRRALGATATS